MSKPSNDLWLYSEPDVIVTENMNRLRLAAGMSQAKLGEAMTAAGFKWDRQTVNNLERALDPEDSEGEATGKRKPMRRVSWAEAWGLAAVFRVPLVELVLPPDPRPHVAVAAGDLQVPESEALAFVVGEGGRIGSAWQVPLSETVEGDNQ